MAVTTVFKAGDGTIFADRESALAYDAKLLRRARVMVLWNANKSFMTDTGRPREGIEAEEVLRWLVENAVALRTALA